MTAIDTSVIISTYNSCEWLEKVLYGYNNQTYRQFEVVIADDGSNDETRSYINNNYDGKVNYYFQNNQGLASARNLGLKYAKGEFIQFLDSDDLLPSEKIENHYKFLCKNADIDVVYSDCKTFVGNNINKLNNWNRKHLFSNGKTRKL